MCVSEREIESVSERERDLGSERWSTWFSPTKIIARAKPSFLLLFSD